MKKEKEHKPNEFENFDNTMRKLMSVPHSEIKGKLDAEKAAKKKPSKKRASGRVSGDKD
jgi:hypothetical protein